MTGHLRRSGRSGIILIVASGVVALLLLLVGVLFGMLRMSRAGAAAAVASSAARLAAEGGMEYAGARLAGEGYPRSSTSPVDRGDDWSGRQGSGVGGQGSDNLSYSHGEPWIDDGDGRFEPGEPFADPDDDGRFGAWSGRLRGGEGARSVLFSLRIECEEGKIPLNAAQMYRSAGGSYAEADWMQIPGVSAWGTFPATVSLARSMNNLGAILRDPVTGLESGPARRWDVPTPGGEPLQASWLGYDLIMNRPLRYRSIQEAEEILQARVGGVYRGKLGNLHRHVSLGPYAGAGGGGRMPANAWYPSPRYVPVSFWTASRETLAALWMYLMTANPLSSAPGQQRFNDFYGEADGAAKICPHSGLRYDQVQLLIWPEEALALADLAIAHRATGDRTWEGLRRAISATAPALFAGDFAALGAPSPGPSPAFQRSWVQAKASLAYQAVAMDPYPYLGVRHDLTAWATGGIDTDPAVGFQPPPVVSFERIYHAMYPKVYDPSGAFGPPQFQAYPGATPPYGLPAFNAMVPESSTAHRVHPRGFPLGLTLAPPSAYSVASRGSSSRGGGEAEVSGGLVLGRLELSTQEDFEAFRPPHPSMEAAGIERIDLPVPWQRRGASGPNVAGTCLSLPRWNFRGITTNPDSYGGLSRTYGALVPADVEGGRAGADLYWPFSEDWNGKDDSACPPAPGLECWTDFSPYTASRNVAGGPPPTNGWPPPFRLPPFLGVGAFEDPFTFGRPLGTTGHVIFQCPGFDPPFFSVPTGSSAERVRAFTIEGWLGPESRLFLAPPGSPTGEPPSAFDQRIAVSTRRGWQGSPDRVGTFVQLHVLWTTSGRRPVPSGMVSTGLQELKPPEWFIQDDPARPGWTYHVVVTGELTGTGATPATANGTRLCLYLDGAKRFDQSWIGSPVMANYSHSRGLTVPNGWEELSVRAVDELRFSGSIRPASGPPPDRFRRDGIYISPLYRFQGTGRLGLVQWSGMIPAGYGSPIGVEVLPCDPAGVEGSPIPLPGGCGAVNDLAALGMPRCPAFRYKVRFAGGPAGTMHDVPVFESIWIRFQPGGGPAWSAWESR